MKLIRILSFLLAILTLSLALASCGTPADTTAAPETTAAPVTTAEPEPEPVPVRLRVGSYNIANGREIDHDMSKLAKDITDKKLDIVGLQEVDRFATRSKYIDIPKVLSELTGLEYYYYTKAINIAGNEAKYGTKGEYGTLILSRYPIISSESVLLQSASYEQRAYGHVQIDVDGTVIDFFNTHLSYENATIRKRQFETLAEKISGLERCILTGDFNISSFDDYAPVAFLKKACTVHGAPVTYPKSNTTIDNILFTDNFKLVERSALANGHSDHNMLWAKFEFTVTLPE